MGENFFKNWTPAMVAEHNRRVAASAATYRGLSASEQFEKLQREKLKAEVEVRTIETPCQGYEDELGKQYILVGDRYVPVHEPEFYERLKKVFPGQEIGVWPIFDATDENLMALYAEFKSVWEISSYVNLSGQSVWERLKKLGVEMERNDYTDEQRKLIEDFYKAGFKKGELDKFCKEHGFLKPNVARFAREQLGLTSYTRTTTKEVAAKMGARVKKWIAEHGHPKGMAGKKHTQETLEAIGQKIAGRWAAMSHEERRAHTDKQLRAKAEKNGGILPFRKPHGLWKSGWEEIGGKKFFARSMWEVNFALYLQLMKDHGYIREWEYEPQTFWFDGIKRGTNNYTPDFRVTLPDGTFEYREVKGWWDDRSKTKIKRMRLYHPDVKLRIFDSKWFKANGKKLAMVIPGWRRKERK